jgi:DNA-directed RNA polymerase subunit RPC12/RpoP
MARVMCPSCGEELRLSDHLRMGQRVSCHHCAEKLVVMRLTPVELEWPDGGELDEDEGYLSEATTKIKTKRRSPPPGLDWYDATERKTDYGGRALRTGKTKKKKNRQRRYDWDEV